jgi:hypothetical protein
LYARRQDIEAMHETSVDYERSKLTSQLRRSMWRDMFHSILPCVILWMVFHWYLGWVEPCITAMAWMMITPYNWVIDLIPSPLLGLRWCIALACGAFGGLLAGAWTFGFFMGLLQETSKDYYERRLKRRASFERIALVAAVPSHVATELDELNDEEGRLEAARLEYDRWYETEKTLAKRRAMIDVLYLGTGYLGKIFPRWPTRG